jgi:predicted nuclease of predicted toxin-antitoxin system
VRFLADMGISRTIVHELRDLGHDAAHLSETRNQHLPDDSVIQKARQEDRVILTHDLDFTRLLSLGEESKPSAIIFRLSSMRPENVLGHLRPALQSFATELESGALVTVNDRASRCKTLPIRRQE